MVPRKELPEEVTGELRLNDEKGQARPVLQARERGRFHPSCTMRALEGFSKAIACVY